MAGKGRFRIPSAKEMDKIEETPQQMKSLFATHKSGKVAEKPGGPSTAATGAAPAAAANYSTMKKVPVPQDKSSVSQISTDQAQHKITQSSSVAGRELNKPTLPSENNRTATASGNGDKSNIDKEASPVKQISVSKENPVAGNKPGKTNSIIVSTRQKGNPILKHVRNVPWEFGDIVPDYVLGTTTCCLFLSLRYHALNPNYIYERFKQLGHSYDLRVLLVQVDTKDPQHALKSLAKVCILADCTLILAWTPEEAGRYLETYKSFEVKPPDLIMEKTESNYMSQLTDFLTTVKKVNKTDAMTLLTAFGSVEKIVSASEEDLSLCPGFGPQKAKRLHDIFHEPFIKVKKAKPDESPTSPTKAKSSPTKKMDTS